MSTPPLPVISSPRRSRLRLWLTLGGITVLIAIGVPFLIFYRLAHRFEKEYAPVAATLPAELAAARKEGLPTTPKELRPNTPVPDRDNAAPLYRKLTTLYRQKSIEEADNAFLTSLSKAVTRTQKEDEEIREFLKTRLAALQIAGQAAQKPKCDFARDWSQGIETDFPELSAMRAGARLLLLRAALRSDENKPFEALQDVTLAANIARHAASDPTLISALVKIAIQAIAHRRFVEILQRHGNNPAVLPAARETALVLGDSVELRHAFKGELVLMRATFKELGSSPDSSEKMRRQGIRIPISNPKVCLQMADAWQSKSIAYWRKVQSSLTDSKGDLAAFEEAMESIQNEEDANRFAPGYEMNAILNSVFLKAPSKVMQNQASDHLRKQMVELLQHRRKTGRFPDSLEDLPDTAAKLDPFSNQPLKYKKSEKGFVIYSVSNNRKDDGGSIKSVKVEDASWPEDIVVLYPRQ